MNKEKHFQDHKDNALKSSTENCQNAVEWMTSLSKIAHKYELDPQVDLDTAKIYQNEIDRRNSSA